MKRRLLYAATFLIIGLLVLPGASAGEDSRWYLGFGIGSSDDDLLSESDTGIKLFGGYEFNQYFGVETAFVDLGEFLGFLEQYGWALEVVGSLPVGEKFTLFAKAGMFSWDLEVFGETVEDGNDSTFGVGGQWAFAEHWAVRGEYEQFNDISGGDVDLFSVGLLYRF
jgi:OOP family OmpA-OmpF porin